MKFIYLELDRKVLSPEACPKLLNNDNNNNNNIKTSISGQQNVITLWKKLQKKLTEKMRSS